MNYTVKANQTDATRLGKNSTTWQVEIDAAALTQEQRERLASALHENYICAPNRIIDDTGGITASSIQTAIAEEADEKAREEQSQRAEDAKHLAIDTTRIERYEMGGSNNYLSDYYYTTPADRAAFAALEKRRIAETRLKTHSNPRLTSISRVGASALCGTVRGVARTTHTRKSWPKIVAANAWKPKKRKKRKSSSSPTR